MLSDIWYVINNTIYKNTVFQLMLNIILSNIDWFIHIRLDDSAYNIFLNFMITNVLSQQHSWVNWLELLHFESLLPFGRIFYNLIISLIFYFLLINPLFDILFNFPLDFQPQLLHVSLMTWNNSLSNSWMGFFIFWHKHISTPMNSHLAYKWCPKKSLKILQWHIVIWWRHQPHK